MRSRCWRRCNGPLAPAAWRGGLPITYHVGPGPAKVHLKLEFNWDIKPIYNVIARIPGSAYPDEWIIRGNHHDAWVNGAEDPVSGQVAMMEEARAMGDAGQAGMEAEADDHFLRLGWRGARPAWVHRMGRDACRRNYSAKPRSISTRMATGAAFCGVEGSHTLEKFVNGVARDVEDPRGEDDGVRSACNWLGL